MFDDLYDGLPEDPEEAFLELEKRFRADRDQKCGRFDPDQWFPADQYLEYMRRVLSAAAEFDLSFQGMNAPGPGNLNWETYRHFQGDLDFHLAALSIRRSRRDSHYTVQFDSKTKQIVSHHIATIREIIIKLEVEEWKREALLRKLNDLQAEVDRTRFRYQIWAAFTIEAAEVMGQAAEKAEPIRKFIDTVAQLVWGAKQGEQNKSLPPPTAPKRIPGPKQNTERKTTADDDIPF